MKKIINYFIFFIFIIFLSNILFGVTISLDKSNYNNDQEDSFINNLEYKSKYHIDYKKPLAYNFYKTYVLKDSNQNMLISYNLDDISNKEKTYIYFSDISTSFNKDIDLDKTLYYTKGIELKDLDSKNLFNLESLSDNHLVFEISKDIDSFSMIIFEIKNLYDPNPYYINKNFLVLDNSEIVNYNLFQINKQILSFYSNDLNIYDKGLYFDDFIDKELEIPKKTCFDTKAYKEDKGYTGSDSFNYFGFNKLFYFWDFENITSTSFDFGNYYIDQDQLKITSQEKLNLIAEKQFINYNGLYLKKNETTDLIENSYNYVNLDFNNTFSDLNSLENQILEIDSFLKDLTIINFSNYDFNLTNYPKIIDNFLKNKSYENKEYKNYQVSLNDLYKNYNNFKNQVIKDKDVNSSYILYKILDQDDYLDNIYLANSLNKFIVNLKPIDDSLTKNIFENKKFLDNFYEYKVNKLDFSKNPNTYLIELDNINLENKSLEINFNKLNNFYKDQFNTYNENLGYQKNILFLKNMNANYYDYGEIPFNNKKSGIDYLNKEYHDNFEEFEKVQEGYVFKYHDDFLPFIYFANIRPLIISTNLNNKYLFEYFYNEFLEVKDFEWIFNKLNKEGLILKDLKKIYTKSHIASLASKDHIAAYTTFFLFNNLDNKKETNYQLKVSSEKDFFYNIKPNDYFLNKNKLENLYLFNKDISNNTFFYGLDISTIDLLFNNINHEDICFDVDLNKLEMWINPSLARSYAFYDLNNSNKLEYLSYNNYYKKGTSGPSESFKLDLSFQEKNPNSRNLNVYEKMFFLHNDLLRRLKYDLYVPENIKNKVNYTIDVNKFNNNIYQSHYYERSFTDSNNFYNLDRKVNNFLNYQKNILGYETILKNNYIDNGYINLKYNSLDLIFDTNKINLSISNDLFYELLKINDQRYNSKHIIKDFNIKIKDNVDLTIYNFLKSFWRNPTSTSCSAFVSSISKPLFKLNYGNNHAGLLKRQNSSVIWCYYDNRWCVDDARKKVLKQKDFDYLIPGSVLGIKTRSSNNYQGNTSVLYTHVVLYLGKFDGKHYIVEEWGPKIRVIPITYHNMKNKIYEVFIPNNYYDLLIDYAKFLKSENQTPMTIKEYEEELKNKNQLTKYLDKEDNFFKRTINKFSDFFKNLFN